MPLLCLRRRPSTQETGWPAPQKMSRCSENTETEYPQLLKLERLQQRITARSKPHGFGNDDVGTLHAMALAFASAQRGTHCHSPLVKPGPPCTRHTHGARTTRHTTRPHPRAHPPSPALIREWLRFQRQFPSFSDVCSGIVGPSWACDDLTT